MVPFLEKSGLNPNHGPDPALNMGKLGQPIRFAVTGGSVSPPIDVTVCLVGRERVLSRLDHALEIIEARAAANG